MHGLKDCSLEYSKIANAEDRGLRIWHWGWERGIEEGVRRILACSGAEVDR